MTSRPTLADATAAIIAVGRVFEARGWAPATSGNYSVRLPDGRVAITVSGKAKGRLDESGVMTLDEHGHSQDDRRPSAEAGLHMALYNHSRDVGAVLHSHSAAAVALTRTIEDDGWNVTGHELLKALPGVSTHAVAINIPIVDNSQDVRAIERMVMPRLRPSGPPAYLIRDHGLYGWGRDIDEAERVIEAVEWLIAAELAERVFRGGVR